MFIRASIFPLGKSQSVFQREIHICSGLHSFHIPYTKCIQALPLMAPSMQKVKKLFSREQCTTVNLYRYDCCHLQGAWGSQEALSHWQTISPNNGVGIKLLKAGKSSALLNPNPINWCLPYGEALVLIWHIFYGSLYPLVHKNDPPSPRLAGWGTFQMPVHNLRWKMIALERWCVRGVWGAPTHMQMQGSNLLN